MRLESPRRTSADTVAHVDVEPAVESVTCHRTVDSSPPTPPSTVLSIDTERREATGGLNEKTRGPKSGRYRTRTCDPLLVRDPRSCAVLDHEIPTVGQDSAEREALSYGLSFARVMLPPANALRRPVSATYH